MNNSLGFITLNLYAFIIIVFIRVIFNSKERLHNVEDNVYSKLLNITGLTTLSGIVLGILIDPSLNIAEIIIHIANKIYLLCLTLWILTLTFYTFYIALIKEGRNKKHINSVYLIGIINAILVLLLPLDIKISHNSAVSEGLSVFYTWGFVGIGFILQMIFLLIDHKNMKSKKYIPIYLLIFFGCADLIIQMLFPDLNYLINPSLVLIVLFMYFTIENPDVKMLEKIERAKLHAEQANRAKSDFLSSMSHEIRTPLNAIVGFSEDIRDYIDEGDTERIKEDADLIVSSSETLLEIVGNIIDISKIESEKIDIVEKEYKPKEEIEKLTKATSTRIGDKPIDFHLYIAPDIPYELIGDSGKVKQVINNLLTNSIKYTEKGEINLRIDCINQNNMSVLKISCQDTGRGIKKENIEKLFTKFERLDIEKNTTTEGTGLGLAITKSLVEMMGGKINVQSRFGEGSIFIAQIPQKIKTLMSPTGNVEEINNPIKEAHIEEQPRIINSEHNNNIKKVLIVDDNKLNITVAKKVLDEIVEEVESVMSGQECIDKINAGEKYDVILMDIMMPEMSGETTFKKLKEIPDFNIPVIALTADAESTSRAKYLAEGFNDYIAKPFKKDEIKAILDKYSSIDSTKIQNAEYNQEEKEVPKYDPNVDRLKDGKTYAFDGDEVKIVESNDIETL